MPSSPLATALSTSDLATMLVEENCSWARPLRAARYTHSATHHAVAFPLNNQGRIKKRRSTVFFVSSTFMILVDRYDQYFRDSFSLNVTPQNSEFWNVTKKSLNFKMFSQ
jgi:hypothetical protein